MQVLADPMATAMEPGLVKGLAETPVKSCNPPCAQRI